MSLNVCASCSRHVRETPCPFCGADVELIARAPAPRVARIVLLGGAAAIASACSSAPSPQPMYGAVMPDASADGATDAAQNDSAPGPMYGAVMPDAGDQ